MLEGDFFTITSLQKEALPAVDDSTGSVYRAAVSLNPLHRIFNGHFPGNPVVPGVCQIQMIREIVEKGWGKSGRLVSADNVKFLSMITPGEHPVLQVECRVREKEQGYLDIQATIVDEDVIFLKFKGVLCINLF
jgi:3-hydroxyacyl-[acyl-carrier-protein] dehydratase